MQAAWTRWFGLQGEDSRKLRTMLPIFYCNGIAESLNFTAFMALFNQRFGVQFLPYVYILEALLMSLEGWVLAKLTGRMTKAALMRFMYVLMALVLVANALALIGMRLVGVDFRWYYPVLFLSSNFVVRQLTLLLWSTAFDLCPTQQAKRLMPIFVASTTTGGVTAGLIGYVLGRTVGTEAVYALAPLFMFVGFWSFRKSLAQYLIPLTLREEKRLAASASTGLAVDKSEGGFVRQTLRSPFLLSAVGLMTLMPALYFMIEYQFFNAAEARFPEEGELTSYYGLITSLQFLFCLGLQTVSNRLMNRAGASNVLLGIAILFLAGFGLTAALFHAPGGLAVVSGSYAVLYILLYYIAEPCYQLFFKMMPSSQRDKYRYFAQGVAASGGILIGSLMSALHSAGAASLFGLALAGFALSVLLVSLAWFGRRLYVKELVRGVQSLYGDLTESAASFLGGFSASKMFDSVTEYLKHSNDFVRELALELMGKANNPGFLPVLTELLQEPSPRIRIAALRAMTLQGASLQDLVKVAAFLEDVDPLVRVECVKLIARAKHLQSQAHYFIRMKLLDEHPLVVAEAIKALYGLGSEESYAACDEALALMFDNNAEWIAIGCRTVAELGKRELAPVLMQLLEDERPSVKAASAAALGDLGRVESVSALIALVPGADKELRSVIREALVAIGEPGWEAVKEGTRSSDPFIWELSIAALSRMLPEARLHTELAELCVARLSAASEERLLPAALAVRGDSDLSELAAQRCAEIERALADGTWAVLAGLTDERVIGSLKETIRDESPEVRENGLEVLAEGLGDRKVSGALLELYRRTSSEAEVAAASQWQAALGERSAQVVVREALQWNDEWLKRIAEYAELKGETTMAEERKFLSMMDKVVFLKQVSLFSGLSVDELGLLAGIAQEEMVPEDTMLVRRGEPNASLYLILEGNVELSSDAATIGVLGPKQSFGETTALDGSPSSVSAQAFFGDVRVLALQGESVTRLIRLYPEIGIGLLLASSARVRLLETMLLKMG